MWSSWLRWILVGSASKKPSSLSLTKSERDALQLVIAQPTLGATRAVATRVMQEIKDEHKGKAFEFLTIDQMRTQVYE